MKNNFRIKTRVEGGNMVFEPTGVLDGSAACELVLKVKEYANQYDNIIIKTERLITCEFGINVFKTRASGFFTNLSLQGPNSFSI